MFVDSIQDEVAHAVEPVVSGLGFDLVEVQVARAGKRRIVRVLADRPQGGITLSDCTKISRALAAAVEVTHLADGPYTLEVSSPGLDRRLTTARDFKRYVGESLTLQLVDGRQREGVLEDVDEEFVKLGDGPAIPFAQVQYGTRNY